MKTIKLSREEEEALREVIYMAGKHLDMGEGQKHLESIQIQIERAPDDTVMFMELVDTRNKCEDCGIVTTDLIVKGDHHGGVKTVCRNRDACHSRSY